MEDLGLLDFICSELDIELNKPFYGIDRGRKYNKYKLTDNCNLYIWEESTAEIGGIWHPIDIKQLLLGEIKPTYVPSVNEKYYYPDLIFKEMFGVSHWRDNSYHWHRLKNGFVFQSKEEAINKALYMLDTLGLIELDSSMLY